MFGRVGNKLLSAGKRRMMKVSGVRRDDLFSSKPVFPDTLIHEKIFFNFDELDIGLDSQCPTFFATKSLAFRGI